MSSQRNRPRLRTVGRAVFGAAIALALRAGCGQKTAATGGKTKDTFVIARQRAFARAISCVS